ncbi:hypothetical protein R1sor_002706 [Riccia sorocarpa]|uniref:Septum formation inhibitor MinC C-terminal domain-containing protein n=1 Tax=Riccia sorocarpa TaxID=122646 RepID=A0ABD3H3H7_9MARC
MASRLLLNSLGGSSAVTAHCILVTPFLQLPAGKGLRLARGESFHNTWKSYGHIINRARVRRSGLPGNEVVIRSNPESCKSDVRLQRSEHSQACRSMSSGGVDGVQSSSGEIGEEFRGGGEMTSDCLYVKRSIADGEVIEHSGSVIVFGDVKQRGYVSASGDVVVLGRLQGSVQAGKSGNHSAKIFISCHDSGTIRIGEEATLQLVEDGSYFPRVAELEPGHSRILIRPVIGDSQKERKPPGKRQGDSNNKAVDSVLHSSTAHSRKTAQVALFTGIYISVAGLFLFSFPKLFGILFDLQHVSLGWIQVGAVLAVVFGVYYIGTAVGDMRGIQGAQAFYYSTVVGRIFLFFSFTWLVIIGAVPSPLLLDHSLEQSLTLLDKQVGFINLLGAGLMWRALVGTQK